MNEPGSRTEWVNWSGALSARPRQWLEPASEEAITELLSATTEAVRTVGSSHSCVSLCSTDETLLSLRRLQGIHHIDREARRAEVWAGSELHRLGKPLREHGLALSNMGDIDRQSVAGAFSTGTHGTGPSLGVLATQITSLRLIRADGSTMDLDESSPELAGAAVSLGSLGVLTRITLQLEPAYRLHERMWKSDFEHCLEQLDERIARHRHFEFFYFPGSDRCAMKSLDRTEDGPDPTMPYDAERFEGERIDWSDRIFPSERNRRFNEIEFALPAAAGPECVRELRHLMRQRFPEITWPLEYRTVGADRLWLSPATERDTVTIAAHQGAELPHEAFFAEAEAVFRSHDGRPHWGKWHRHRADRLSGLYPKWREFLALREQLDPDGRFLNSHLRGLFGLETLEPR